MTASTEHYQGITDGLATETAAAVLTVYAAAQAGTVAPNVAAAAIARVIAAANAAATSLADLFVSTQIERQTRKPQPPTGIAPRDDTVRLRAAVATILDDVPEPVAVPEVTPKPVAVPEVTPKPVVVPDAPDPDPVAPAVSDEPAADTTGTRLERLARAEPLETGHVVVEVVIKKLPAVGGWRRVLDADPCERCVRWAEDGRVFPKDAHFKRHLNCNCQQDIVLADNETSSDTMNKETRP